MLRRAFTQLALAAATIVTLNGCAATSDYGYDDGNPGYDAYTSGAGDYFDELSSYGTWVQVADYGWAWCPLDTPVGWRPFTVGYWLWSDDGWLWMSEDPWGATPYHYGRWAYDREYGWVWVPGDVWAPAWVAWRYGDGYVGWAALPPNVGWRAGVGLDYSDYELDQRINRHRWCFTSADDFGETRMRVNVEPSSKNVTLLPRTKNVTKYVPGPTPVERGLPPEMISEQRGRTFVQFHVEDSPTAIAGGGNVNPQTGVVQIYRPKGSVTAVVRERVRNVPAKQRPMPSPEATQRVQEERARLQETVNEQRQELAKEHEREMQSRPPGASVQELRRRQEAEMKAQREDEARQKAELDARERAVTRSRARVEDRAKMQERKGRGRGSDEEDAPPPNASNAQPDTLRRPQRGGGGR